MKQRLFAISDCLYGLEYLEKMGYSSAEDKQTLDEMFDRMRFLNDNKGKYGLSTYKRMKDLNNCIKHTANASLRGLYDIYAVEEANKGHGDTLLTIDDVILVGFMEHFAKDKTKSTDDGRESR